MTTVHSSSEARSSKDTDASTTEESSEDSEARSSRESDVSTTEEESSEGSNSGESEADELSEKDTTPITCAMVDDIFHRFRDEYDQLVQHYVEQDNTQEEARRLAYREMVPKFRKAFRKSLQNHLLRAHQLRKEPLYKAIMKTVQEFRDNDYSTEEAIKSALGKRKYKVYAEFPSDIE